MPDHRALVDAFMAHFERTRPSFVRELAGTRRRYPEAFDRIGGELLGWAHALLGEACFDTLVRGYALFVTDVARSQIRFDRTGGYQHHSYDAVRQATYANPAFMNDYHWGVYVNTFGWAHHLRLCLYFQQFFVDRLREGSGRLIDLGSGSGIWHLMALSRAPDWTVTAVDISETSVGLARSMAGAIGLAPRVDTVCGDALVHGEAGGWDAGISCFLLEHLERPAELLANLSRTLKPGALAFVTGGLTASEIDHIHEFWHESELVIMAEQAGFRVLSTLSENNTAASVMKRYLPRSMALVLQKRTTDTW